MTIEKLEIRLIRGYANSHILPERMEAVTRVAAKINDLVEAVNMHLTDVPHLQNDVDLLNQKDKNRSEQTARIIDKLDRLDCRVGELKSNVATEEPALLNCPFCGWTPKMQWNGKLFSLACVNDECDFLPETPLCEEFDDAIDIWNKRV